MVIIELYKPLLPIWNTLGDMRSFLNRKRLSYFILQENPDLCSSFKCSNMQLYSRRWYIICVCKISVRNDIIKDILKKKNDDHWISDGTVVPCAKRITDYQLNIKHCIIYTNKNPLAILNLAAYWCVLLFICLVNTILYISNRVTKMINENILNIYAYCHNAPFIWKPLVRLFHE